MYVASYPRIVAMASLTRRPHSTIVTPTLLFPTYFSLPNYTGAPRLLYQTPRGHLNPLFVWAPPTHYPSPTQSPHPLTQPHFFRHFFLLPTFLGLCTPSLSPYRYLPITNTLPSYPLISPFFPHSFRHFFQVACEILARGHNAFLKIYCRRTVWF
jgi:hypothetical protein